MIDVQTPSAAGATPAIYSNRPFFRPTRRIGVIEYAIRDILAKVPAAQAKGLNIFYGNIGDPAYGGLLPPQNITDAYAEAVLSRKYTGYAPSGGDKELREVLGAFEKIHPSRIFVTNGLSQGIDFVLNALVEDGRNVLLPEYSYPLYQAKVRKLGGETRYYAILENGEPDPEHMRSQIDENTQAIVISNPNNPTGAVYSVECLKAVGEVARQYRIPIIADEVYDMLSYGPPVHPIHTVCPDVLVFRGNGLSKNFLYPGSRLGYLAIHGPEEDVVSTLPTMVKLATEGISENWEKQRAAVAAYSQPITHIPATLAALKERQDAMYNGLAAIPGIKPIRPESSFYDFAQITEGPWPNDREFAFDLLDTTGIVLVFSSAFSPKSKQELAQHPEVGFRIVALDTVQNIQSMLGVLREFMANRIENPSSYAKMEE